MHNAKLIWITPNAEKLVAKIARVSNPKNENNPNSEKLIRYLIEHKHWSPMEMISACMEIHTTRAISPQILRHRSFSFQEFSQRYAIPTDTFPTVIPNLRRQDTSNRQNSIDDLPEETIDFINERIDIHFRHATNLYNHMLDKGVAKECARSVLPLNTVTRLYMSGTIRSWLHYCDLRSGNGTQLEHKLIADSVKKILFDQLPLISSAMWNHETN
tara:strand:+ start:16951 stop:17595 length:645 start_codon:yes stop_codon:yes gene_type:complete